MLRRKFRSDEMKIFIYNLVVLHVLHIEIVEETQTKERVYLSMGKTLDRVLTPLDMILRRLKLNTHAKRPDQY